MSQRTLDPRMLDTSTALPAMSGAALTGLATDVVKINSQTADGDASVNFTSSHFNNSTYSSYEFRLLNLKTSSDGSSLLFRTSADGSSYESSGYKWVHHGYNSAGNAAEQYSESDNAFNVTQPSNWGSASNESLSGIVNLYNPGASEYTKINAFVTYDDDQAGLYLTMASISGERSSAAAVTGAQFIPTAGTLTGTIIMYGIK